MVDKVLLILLFVLIGFTLIVFLVFFYIAIKYRNVNFFTDGKRRIEEMTNEEIISKVNECSHIYSRLLKKEKDWSKIPDHYKTLLIINHLKIDELISLSDSFIENYLLYELIEIEAFDIVQIIDNEFHKSHNTEKITSIIKENIHIIEDYLLAYIRKNITLYGKRIKC